MHFAGVYKWKQSTLSGRFSDISNYDWLLFSDLFSVAYIMLNKKGHIVLITHYMPDKK